MHCWFSCSLLHLNRNLQPSRCPQICPFSREVRPLLIHRSFRPHKFSSQTTSRSVYPFGTRRRSYYLHSGLVCVSVYAYDCCVFYSESQVQVVLRLVLFCDLFRSSVSYADIPQRVSWRAWWRCSWSAGLRGTFTRCLLTYLLTYSLAACRVLSQLDRWISLSSPTLSDHREPATTETPETTGDHRNHPRPPGPP